MSARLVLRGGVLADGRSADVAVDEGSGLIAAVGVVPSLADDRTEDVSGMVVLPSAVETHAHLDKALLSTHSEMPPDLDAAVQEWADQVGELSHESFVERATAAVEAFAAQGTTTIRTHVDVLAEHGLRGLHALIEVRDTMRLRGLADLELVALAGPYGGELGPVVRRHLDEAVEAGVDVIGGSPDLEPDTVASTEMAVVVAVRTGLPIDLHTDQTVDQGFFFLPDYIRLVRQYGLERVAASHCVSLAMQPLDVQRRVADDLAAAGIAVFTMPLSSLFLFGWDEPVSPPRGVTAINVLREAGVTVAPGSDNVRDPFFPFGRCDPFETASVLAMVAHLSPEQAWEMSTSAARRALGRPEVSIAAGSPADLLLVRGANLSEAFATMSPDRLVLHRGRIVARTTSHRTLHV